GPLRPVVREDRHAMAGLDAEEAKAGGEVADGVAEFRDADVYPAPVSFDLQRRRAVERARDGVDIVESFDLHPDTSALRRRMVSGDAQPAPQFRNCGSLPV